MKWKYQVHVEDLSVFNQIERQQGITFPEPLRKLIIEANAGIPEKCRFMLNSDERVLGNMLSYNHKTIDTDSAEDAVAVIHDNSLIPFAIDPFGDYICYCITGDTVVIWEHETGKIIDTKLSLPEFIESLY